MTESDKQWMEIVREINFNKDIIKNSAKKIVSSLNNSKSLTDIDSEFLEILNGLGKIATITGNASRISSYCRELSTAFELARTDRSGIAKSMIIHFMNQVCYTGFDILKKGKKYQISLPKIDVNFMKLGG